MIRDILYTLESPYRSPLEITGFRFGKGEKTAAIVGAIRGNEIQQLYICSLLVSRLRELEAKGAINSDSGILIVPSACPYSMNTGKRFWAVDNTDINRMFPGYDMGETTQRIADGLFRQVRGYSYGIQFASFYMPGDFIPHVRMMETGFQTTSLANLFGMQYILVRRPRPYDTATLNYNWQMNQTNAFSVYTNQTDRIDEASAKLAADAVLRFLSRVGVVKFHCHNGYLSSVIKEDELFSISSPDGGIYRGIRQPGDEVTHGEVLGEILDPYTHDVRAKVITPTDGILFFGYSQPLVMEHAILYRIIRRLHG